MILLDFQGKLCTLFLNTFPAVNELTEKMENVIEKANCSYSVIGKVCIAYFEGIINGVTAIDLGLPAPRGNGAIALRDSDDGNIASF